MEFAEPAEGISTPIEAKPAPSFARLTDVSDGTPLKTGYVAQNQTEEEGKASSDSGSDSEPDSESKNSNARARHRSHEPEYNPWG